MDISVIICSVGRCASLMRTLGCLERADRAALEVEVIVVDNDDAGHVRRAVDEHAGTLPIRYLRESKRGKCHAVNRGLEANPRGALVVFLDDDMETGADWFREVKALSDRHPDHDVFTGSSHVIWPTESVPAWAHERRILPWAFSVMEYGPEDHPLAPGEFMSGNHFWVRSSALQGMRFHEMWGHDPRFILELAERGHRGICGSKPVVGHRVQPELLEVAKQRRRAWVVGRDLPHIRLPFPRTVPQARLAWSHPWRWRARSSANLVRWILKYAAASMHPSRDRRISGTLVATMGIANNLEATVRSGRIVRAARRAAGARSR